MEASDKKIGPGLRYLREVGPNDGVKATQKIVSPIFF